MGRLASTFARLRWTILIVSVAACQKSQPAPWPDAATIEPRLIMASSNAVTVPPRGSRLVGFHLLGAQDVPVPGAVMNFEILDTQTPGSGGAQLSFASGLTDEQGWVTLQVLAGTGSDGPKPLSFEIHASAADVAKNLPVFVTAGALASAEIKPEVEKKSSGEEDYTSISVTFYDDTVCTDLARDPPPPTFRQVQTIIPPDQSVSFSGVVASGVHAVMAVATGARNRIVAKGCADLPGDSLTPSQTMRVSLPLARVHLSAVGTYQVTAGFSLDAQQSGIASVREQWSALSAHACDPASLWLDCTIDALSGDSADDPLDCRPVAGGEGALGALLSARRAASGDGRACASLVDGTGKPSLDTRTYSLFPAGFLPPPLSLANLPNELSDHLALQSTLTVVESGQADVLDIRHSLDVVTLSNATTGTSLSIPATDLGLPVRDVWVASYQPEPGQLFLSSHGFTLRLGSLIRLAFLKSSLATRFGMADVGAFISDLFNGASRSSRSTMLRGCEALDSLLCEEAALDRGCIKAACLAGLDKLAQRLDASFAVLDGPGLDFYLSGGAPMESVDGKQASALSGSFLNAVFSAPSNYSVSGSWSAVRIGPSAP